ncbi:ATP-binding cassette domain-containing protein [Thermogladius sp. 4427co]|uniref:ATP-binding cassette domain-containing protein n=1 Tax=Thermogladius sp. 4427co TaxID=3450718 RepID=UPI003F78B2BF
MDVIVVEKLVKRFKDVTAVAGIDFSVRKGEIFALLGPNGAGKTTTIHIIATLLKPTSGRVEVYGYDVVREPDKVRRVIGIVFQDPSLDNQLTAYDNMYVHGRLYGLKGRQLHDRILELLDFVELREYAYKQVKYYSGGMRRRLEIARALLTNPDILILDEPTIGLDPQSRARIWDYIRKLKKDYDMTILLTTHYMDEADELADRIAIMDHGKIVAMGTSSELKNMLGSDVVYLKFDNGVSSEICSYFEAKVCKAIDPKTIELVVENANKILPEVFDKAFRAGLRISEVSYRKPSLNEVFLHLTGRELRDSLESPQPLARWHR